MAAGQEAISLRWQAELGDLRRQMAEIPGISEKEAKAMARALDRQMKKAEQSAKKAAKAPQKEWKTLQANIKAATVATAAAVGAFLAVAAAVGKVSKASIDYRNDLIDANARTGLYVETLQGLKLAYEGSGQAGDAYLKVAAQLPKVMADAMAGSKKTVDALHNINIEFEDLSTSDQLLRDIVRELTAIEDPSLRAARATDLLGKKVGGTLLQALGDGNDQFEAYIAFADRWGADVAPQAAESAARLQRELAALDMVFAGARDDLTSVTTDTGLLSNALEYAAFAAVFWSSAIKHGFDEAKQAANEFIAPAEALLAGEGLAGAAAAFGAAMQENVDSSFLRNMNKDLSELIASWETVTDGVPSIGDVIGGDDDGGGGGSAAGAKKVMAQISSIAEQATQDQLTQQEKLQAAFEKTKTKLLDIMDEYGDESAAGEAAAAALIAANDRKNRDIAAADQKQADAAAAARAKELESVLDYWDAVAEEQERVYLQRMAFEESAKIAAKAAAADIFGSVATLAELTAQRQGAANAEAGERWFKWYQGLAIVQSAINGALAFQKGIADYGLPWGAVVGAAAAAAVGVEAAVISSQSPPSYHAGGMAYESPVMAPDESTATVLRNEGVLTAAGVASVGGPEGVSRANRSEPVGGGSTTVNLMLSHRTLQRITAPMTKSGGPVARAIKGRSVTGHRTGW